MAKKNEDTMTIAQVNAALSARAGRDQQADEDYRQQTLDQLRKTVIETVAGHASKTTAELIADLATETNIGIEKATRWLDLAAAIRTASLGLMSRPEIEAGRVTTDKQIAELESRIKELRESIVQTSG